MGLAKWHRVLGLAAFELMFNSMCQRFLFRNKGLVLLNEKGEYSKEMYVLRNNREIQIRNNKTDI